LTASQPASRQSGEWIFAPARRLFRLDAAAAALQGIMTMPARSKAQQKAAGAALAAKRGETRVRDLKGASKSMYQSMDEDELHRLAATKRKNKPEHVGKR